MFNTASVHSVQPHALGPGGDGVSGEGEGGVGVGPDGVRVGGDGLGPPLLDAHIPDIQTPKGTELHGVRSCCSVGSEHCPFKHRPSS